MKEMEDILYSSPKPTFLLADNVMVNKRGRYGNAALLHMDIRGLVLISKPC